MCDLPRCYEEPDVKVRPGRIVCWATELLHYYMGQQPCSDTGFCPYIHRGTALATSRRRSPLSARIPGGLFSNVSVTYMNSTDAEHRVQLQPVDMHFAVNADITVFIGLDVVGLCKFECVFNKKIVISHRATGRPNAQQLDRSMGRINA